MKAEVMFKTVAVTALGLALAVVGACGAKQDEAEAGKIAVTTGSPEARELYLRGRALFENLRFNDARELLKQSVEKDPDFALAHLAIANAASSAKEFFSSMEKALAVAPSVTEGERHMILAADAGVKGNVDSQREHLAQLVAAFPTDERAQSLMGNYYFGRQEYDKAIEHYKQATSINDAFPPVYNQMGYAYRFLGRYDESEQSFKKYIELIPDEPNPYDSYAELLMKQGRYEESIENYERALARDPHFAASFVGIGNNEIFMGRLEEARATFGKLLESARNDAERRQAHLWISASYLHEGQPDSAVQELQKMYAIAEEDGDLAEMSSDAAQMGEVYLETGQAGLALEKMQQALELIERASVPEEVKHAARREQLYNESRVALSKGNVELARSKADEYGQAVTALRIPAEMRQHHELLARIAMKEMDFDTALAELGKADQQDPRVLYLEAVALSGKGDRESAKAACEKAANFNALDFDFAFVRRDAQRMMGS